MASEAGTVVLWVRPRWVITVRQAWFSGTRLSRSNQNTRGLTSRSRRRTTALAREAHLSIMRLAGNAAARASPPTLARSYECGRHVVWVCERRCTACLVRSHRECGDASSPNAAPPLPTCSSKRRQMLLCLQPGGGWRFAPARCAAQSVGGGRATARGRFLACAKPMFKWCRCVYAALHMSTRSTIDRCRQQSRANPSVEATRNSGPRYTGLSLSVPRGPLLRAPHLQR